jgi:CheY-like chemotaxis protein
VKEKEVRFQGGGWFFRRILPFRTASNKMEGVVITLTDIDAIKATYRALEERERQQVLAARLGQFALKPHSHQDLFEVATQALAEAFHVERSALFEFTPSRDELALVSGIGWEEKELGAATIPTGPGTQAGHILEEGKAGKAVILENLLKEKRFQLPPLLQEHGVKSGLALILGPHDKPWGLLAVYATGEKSFTSDDLNFFRSVGYIVTESIGRDTILEELEEHKSRLAIVIADDHVVVREGFARILSAHEDLEIVATAANGEEALEAPLTHQPDLVLMDISMPEMNGIEATQEIKRRRPETIVIGLSLHEKEVLGEAMRQAGASTYLQKDVASTSLIKTIRELFPKEKA